MSILILFVTLSGIDDPALPPPLPMSEVRPRLNSDAVQDRVELTLFNIQAFPNYLEILKDKNVTAKEQERILLLLTPIKADRKAFVRPTVELLSNKESKVRLAALKLLAEIGEPKNCAPVLVFLGVKDQATITQAAKTLAAIGNDKTVIAMNVYLANGNYNKGDKTEEIVRKYRDQLKARLQKENEPQP